MADSSGSTTTWPNSSTGRDGAIELAAHYLELGQPRSALKVLATADLDDLRTFRLRAIAYTDLRMFAKAEEAARWGLEREPDDVSLLEILTNAQLPGDAAAAELTLRRALAIEPENARLLGLYVIVLMEQDRYEWAEKMLDRAMRIAPEESAHIRAFFLVRAAGSSEAKGAAEALLRDWPDDAAAHYLRGHAAMRAWNWRAGLRHFREAARINPGETLFTETARLMATWWVMPAHWFGGIVHIIASIGVVVTAIIVWLAHQDDGLSSAIFGTWVAIVAYRWLAYLTIGAILNRRMRAHG